MMDNSNHSYSQQDESPPSPSGKIASAILSATIFGSLGALLGRWLGRHGNDPRSKLAEHIMQWSMGVFCATLGAYSSLKASEQIEKEQAREAARSEVDTQAIANGEVHSHAQLGSVPETIAHAKAAKNEGKLAEVAHHVALEK